MNPATLIERYKVPLAWGVLALLVYVLVAGLVVPVVEAYREGGARLEQGYARLARLQLIASQQPDAIREQEPVVERLLARFVYPGAMGADALVLELRKKMEALAEKHGVDLQSVDSKRPKREDGIDSVGLTVSAQSDLEGVIGVLRELQEQVPLLLVDDLSLQSAAARTSGRRALRDASPVEQRVGMQFSLEAFLSAGTP